MEGGGGPKPVPTTIIDSTLRGGGRGGGSVCIHCKVRRGLTEGGRGELTKKENRGVKMTAARI